MTEDGKLVYGGWLVQSWGDFEATPPIEGGALYEEGGRIVAVGTYEQLRKKYPHAISIGDPNYVVIPGFVNAHSHGRGFTTHQMGQPDEPLETRVIEFVIPSAGGGGDAESGAAINSGYDPYLDTLYACIKQIASGITTTVHSQIYLDGPVGPYADITRKVVTAYRDSGIRCAFTLGIRDRNTFTFIDDDEFFSMLPADVGTTLGLRRGNYEMGFPEYYELLQALSEEYPEVEFQLSPWNPVWCSDALMEKISEASERDGWRIQTHLVETRYQAEYARKIYGKSTIARLKEFGMLSRRFSGAHCIWMDPGDIEIMKESEAQVVYNPSSNMRLGSGLASPRDFLDMGVPVAFGLDSLSMNDDEDYFQDLRLGQQIQNRSGIDIEPIPAGTMFEMATRAGVQVAGIDGIGSLAEGNWADVVLLSWPEIEGGIAHHPLPDVMMRRAKASHVKTVIIGGKIFIRDGQWLDWDMVKMVGDLRASIGSVKRRPPEPLKAVKEAVRKIMREYD